MYVKEVEEVERMMIYDIRLLNTRTDATFHASLVLDRCIGR